MHDVAILGAGLSGLTLAYLLRDSGLDVILLEARHRTGGRILTSRPAGRASIEMGATWLGRKHTHLTALLTELNLDIEPQASNGRAYYEPSANTGSQLVQLPPDPAPSHVIKRSSSALTEALVGKLPDGWLQLGLVVKSLDFTGSDASVRIETPAQIFHGRTVVSTLPPNLLQVSVPTSPALPASLTAVAKTCHTWMGDSIKVGLSYAEPFWRKPHQPNTGALALYSNVGPLSECYEHAHVDTSRYAIKGFLRPELASLSREERRVLVLAQLGRTFGPVATAPLRYEELVWADEAFTYAPYDGFVLPHQHGGHPALQAEYFDGRLLLGGSETASHYPGYMDGAVEAARRVARRLLG